MSAWFEFDPLDPHTVFRGAGTYVIYSNGVVVYVGSSRQVRHRIQAHRLDVEYGVRASEWTKYPNLIGKAKPSERLGDWAMREIRLIHRLRPPLNVHGKSREVRIGW